MIKPKQHNNFYVITGGPGVGKTTLLKELQRRNYNVIPGISREIIKEQQTLNGKALPWKNKRLYKDIMFERSIKSFEQTGKNLNNGNLIFFDRGFLDTICYAKLIQSEVNEQMKSYARNWRYNKSVFILPPWQEIYKTDNERKQDWEEAVLTFKQMRKTYVTYGYNVIEVPKMPVNKRTDFVLSFIQVR